MVTTTRYERPSRLGRVVLWLGAVALVLAIVLMAGAIFYFVKAQVALGNLRDALEDAGSGVGEVIDECWTAGDGDELCAPGGRDGVQDGVADGE